MGGFDKFFGIETAFAAIEIWSGGTDTDHLEIYIAFSDEEISQKSAISIDFIEIGIGG